MMITDYFLRRGYWFALARKITKVDPVEKPGDPAYEAPKREQKGKRDFPEKGEKTQKIPEKNSINLWV